MFSIKFICSFNLKIPEINFWIKIRFIVGLLCKNKDVVIFKTYSTIITGFFVYLKNRILYEAQKKCFYSCYFNKEHNIQQIIQ